MMPRENRSVAETVTGFLRAENERDWEEYGRYLAPDVERTTYGPERETVRGREEFVEGVKRMYAGRDAAAEIKNMAVDWASGVAFVGLATEGRRSEGVFRVEREYLEDVYFGGR